MVAVVILSTVFFVFVLFVFVLVVLSVAMNAFASAVDCVVFASAVFVRASVAILPQDFRSFRSKKLSPIWQMITVCALEVSDYQCCCKCDCNFASSGLMLCSL